MSKLLRIKVATLLAHVVFSTLLVVWLSDEGGSMPASAMLAAGGAATAPLPA